MSIVNTNHLFSSTSHILYLGIDFSSPLRIEHPAISEVPYYYSNMSEMSENEWRALFHELVTYVLCPAFTFTCLVEGNWLPLQTLG